MPEPKVQHRHGTGNRGQAARFLTREERLTGPQSRRPPGAEAPSPGAGPGGGSREQSPPMGARRGSGVSVSAASSFRGPRRPPRSPLHPARRPGSRGAAATSAGPGANPWWRPGQGASVAPAPGGRRTPARRRLVATVCVRQSSPGSGTWGPVTRPGWRLTMVKTELTSRKTHRRRFARRRQTCTGRTRGALWRPGSPRLCAWGRDPPGGAVPPVLTETPESCVGPGPPPAPHGLGWSPCMRPDVPGVTLTHFA